MKNIVYIIVGVLFVAGIAFVIISPGKPSKYDGFAQCIKDSGAKFYGAFWCSHCQKQKALFGKSQQYLPYIECSTPDGRGQMQICKDAGVTSYPTWEIGNSTSTRLYGEIALTDLASATQCALPQ